MSFQAYLANIQAKTGKSAADFRALAEQKGFTHNGQLATGVKAGAIVVWLKQDFQLGHGHSMAIVALLKGSKCEERLTSTGKADSPTFSKYERSSSIRMRCRPFSPAAIGPISALLNSKANPEQAF